MNWTLRLFVFCCFLFYFKHLCHPQHCKSFDIAMQQQRNIKKENLMERIYDLPQKLSVMIQTNPVSLISTSAHETCMWYITLRAKVDPVILRVPGCVEPYLSLRLFTRAKRPMRTCWDITVQQAAVWRQTPLQQDMNVPVIGLKRGSKHKQHALAN